MWFDCAGPLLGHRSLNIFCGNFLADPEMLAQYFIFIQYRDETMFIALVVFDQLQQSSAAMATTEDKYAAVA